jgi:hypothetical protein
VIHFSVSKLNLFVTYESDVLKFKLIEVNLNGANYIRKRVSFRTLFGCVLNKKSFVTFEPTSFLSLLSRSRFTFTTHFTARSAEKSEFSEIKVDCTAKLC